MNVFTQCTYKRSGNKFVFTVQTKDGAAELTVTFLALKNLTEEEFVHEMQGFHVPAMTARWAWSEWLYIQRIPEYSG